MNFKILILIISLTIIFDCKSLAQHFYINDWYIIKDKNHKTDLQLAKFYLEKAIIEYKNSSIKYDWQLPKILRDFIRIKEDINQYLPLVQNLKDEQFLNQILIGKSSINVEIEDSLIYNKKLIAGKLKYFERLLREGKREQAFTYIESNFNTPSDYEKKEVLSLMCNGNFSFEQIQHKIMQYGFDSKIWLEIPLRSLIENEIITPENAFDIVNYIPSGKIDSYELDNFYGSVASSSIKIGNVAFGLNVMELISQQWQINSLLQIICNDLYENFSEKNKIVFKERILQEGKLYNNYGQDMVFWKDKKPSTIDKNLLNFLKNYEDKLADHMLFQYYLRLGDPYFALKITDTIKSNNSGTQYVYGISKLIELNDYDEAFKRIGMLTSSQTKDDVILKVCNALLEKRDVEKVLPYLDFHFHNTETSKDFLMIELVYFYGKENNLPEVEKYMNKLSDVFSRAWLYHDIARYYMGIKIRYYE